MSEFGTDQMEKLGSTEWLPTLIECAAKRGTKDFFKYLWGKADDDTKREVARRCQNQMTFEVVREAGYGSLVSKRAQNELCLIYLDKYLSGVQRKRGPSESEAQAGVIYEELIVNCDIHTKVEAWLKILECDRVDVLSKMISLDRVPTKGESLWISPRDLYKAARGVPLPERYQNEEGQEDDTPRPYRLEELVCIVGPRVASDRMKSFELLGAAVSTPEGREVIENSPEACGALVRYTNKDILTTLKARGLNLACLKNDFGQNPLHFAVGNQNPWAEEVAKIHPEWVIEKNSKGLVPVELLDNEVARTELARKFEEIVLESTVLDKQVVKGVSIGKVKRM